MKTTSLSNNWSNSFYRKRRSINHCGCKLPVLSCWLVPATGYQAPAEGRTLRQAGVWAEKQGWSSTPASSSSSAPSLKFKPDVRSLIWSEVILSSHLSIGTNMIFLAALAALFLLVTATLEFGHKEFITLRPFKQFIGVMSAQKDKIQKYKKRKREKEFHIVRSGRLGTLAMFVCMVLHPRVWKELMELTKQFWRSNSLRTYATNETCVKVVMTKITKRVTLLILRKRKRKYSWRAGLGWIAGRKWK